jgi:hypothetical protein
MRKKAALACAVLLLAVGLTGATTLVKMEFSDLAKQADQVVVGTVVGTLGQWEETHNFIHTDVTISVENYLRGDGPAEITLRTPGGRVGDEGQVAHGAATFEVGEKVLVFLTTWEDGTPKVLGYVQGKSRVITGDDGTLRLQGGRAHGMSVQGAAHELQRGLDHNIPLRPVR